MKEVYRLVLGHYFVDDDGKRNRMGEPIVVEHIFDRTQCGSSVVVNRLFEDAKYYTLSKLARRTKND